MAMALEQCISDPMLEIKMCLKGGCLKRCKKSAEEIGIIFRKLDSRKNPLEFYFWVIF